MAVTIRTAEVCDAAVIAHIQAVSWKNGFAGILDGEALDLDETRLKAMWERVLQNNARTVLLEIDGHPHCMASWDQSREEWYDGVELICIHSLPDHWHEGYGSMVVERVLEDAKAAGYDRIMLWVFEENTRARRFYEKHGFALTEHTKTQRGPVEVMYEREL